MGGGGAKGHAPPPLLPPPPCLQGAHENQIEDVRAATEAARGRVVASPARLREDVDAAARAAEAAHADLHAAAAQCKTLEMRQEVVAKAERDVRKALGLLAEVEVRGGGKEGGSTGSEQA